MRTKIFLPVFLLVIISSATSCNKKSNSPNSQNSQESSSIIVEFQTSSDGMGSLSRGTKTRWIKDFGRKEATLIKETSTFSMMGTSTTESKESLSIIDGDYSYSIDLKNKTGVKQNIKEFKEMSHLIATQVIATGDLPENLKDFVEKNGGNWLPSETILSKNCDVFELMGTKQWVYKNIALKVESDIMGVKTSEIATKIEEDAIIPDNHFKVPSDIQLIEKESIMGSQPIREMSADEKEWVSLVFYLINVPTTKEIHIKRSSQGLTFVITANEKTEESFLSVANQLKI